MVTDLRTGPNQGERIIAVACSGDPVPGASYGFLRGSLQVGEAEEWRAVLDIEEMKRRDSAPCDGICVTAGDIGMTEWAPSYDVAYPHPECPRHGDGDLDA